MPTHSDTLTNTPPNLLPEDAQLRARNLDGAWLPFAASRNGNPTYAPQSYEHIIWPYRGGMSLLDLNLDGSRTLWPVMLNAAEPNTIGQLRGVAAVSGQGLTAETLIRLGAVDWMAFHNITRTEPRGLPRRGPGLNPWPPAYQTGISSSPTNLLQTLVSWLTDQGWTLDLSQADASGWRAHLHKSGLYVNLRAAMNEKIWTKSTGAWDHSLGYGIGLYLGDGHDGGASWVEQPGRPLRTDTPPSTSGCGMNLPAGSVAGYHFFDDGLDNVIVVVEKSPGVFVHMGWGLRLADMGAPEDFPYFFASTSAYRNTETRSQPVQLPAGQPDRLGALRPAAPRAPRPTTTPTPAGSCGWTPRRSPGRWVADCTGDEADDGYTGRFMDGPLNPNGYDNQRQTAAPRLRLLGRPRRPRPPSPARCCSRSTSSSSPTPAARWAPLGYPPNVFWCEAVGAGYAAAGDPPGRRARLHALPQLRRAEGGVRWKPAPSPPGWLALPTGPGRLGLLLRDASLPLPLDEASVVAPLSFEALFGALADPRPDAFAFAGFPGPGEDLAILDHDPRDPPPARPRGGGLGAGDRGRGLERVPRPGARCWTRSRSRARPGSRSSTTSASPPTSPPPTPRSTG